MVFVGSEICEFIDFAVGFDVAAAHLGVAVYFAADKPPGLNITFGGNPPAYIL